MAQPVKYLIAAVAVAVSTAAFAQGPVPIADNTAVPRTPSGISELDVHVDGELAYLFKADDGADVAHFLGGFQLELGDNPAHHLEASEAVVWISRRQHAGKDYRHVDVLLWRDAEILEPGGTLTTGPALFVTLNTFANINLGADDIAMESSADREVYRNGNAVRKALRDADVFPDDADASLRVLDTTGLSLKDRKPRVKPPMVFQSPGELTTHSLDERDIITVVGGAYMSRGAPEEAGFLEIQADALVVYMPPRSQMDNDAQRRRRPNRQLMAGAFGEQEVEGVYLEGDVRMRQGQVSIRAERLYYDFLREKAVIMDTVMHTRVEGREMPLYVRASEVRQINPEEFIAEDAKVSTSEFHTPHYHLGAGEARVLNQTPLEPTGRRGAVRAGAFVVRNATFNVNNIPLLWFPLLKGSVDTSDSAIRRIRTGYSDDFGAELETNWQLFNVLGLEQPDGFEGDLRLDLYSERGPGIGTAVEYEREKYFGEMRSYLIHDDGVDNLGRLRPEPVRSDWRGRGLIRHRQYLEDDWQLTLELSYISDEGFLEEYFEREFDNDKEQETLVYLKKQRDDWALTATAQTRLMDFTTQTERFPDFAYFVAGRPLGSTPATWFSENRAGYVRYRHQERRFFDALFNGTEDSSGSVGRADSRQEVGVPLDIGDMRIVPFVTGRGTVYDDSPENGGLGRLFGAVGVRGSMYFWKVFPNARSTMFDIDGVRHMIKADFTGWLAESNHTPYDVYPFDTTVGGEVVESYEATSGAQVGIRQRWQTKRGEGVNRRIVDFLTLDVELGMFDDATSRRYTNGYTSFSRPENSIAHNYVNSSLVWRINDRTALLGEMNYDTNDGEVDILNLSLAVERTPRFSYLIGYRFIEEADSNLLAFDLNYRLSEKHTFAVRELFDLERGRTLDFTIGIIRKFPRWYGAIAFEFDDTEDDFGVSLSVWPEGLPNATIGSRRFTGLATSTRLRND